ncbi:MAG: permease-like cell division protein FtsX [Clostridia bacterium]|nr:permease-like cell division protein FtsX [Clostridia bacterium]
MFRNFKYYLKSALSSFVRNGIMTFASFATVACCLFLFGVFFLFTANMNFISRQIESQCQLTAYIHPDVTDATQKSAYEAILKIDGVENAELETKAQAFTNFKEMLGDRADVLEGLEGKDFLRSSVKVSLMDIRNSEAVVKKIARIPGVEEVRNRQDIVGKVISFTDIVKHGSIIAMIILLIVAIFIIQNTIKLSVYAREREIKIMKFVGATDHFIRTPFVLEGIIIGSLGFIVSFVIIMLGYNAAIGSISGIVSMFAFVQLESVALLLALCMAGFGVLMGAAGSGLSIKRYLKV